MRKEVYETQRAKVLEYFERQNIALTEQEKQNVEVADFGLDDIEHVGLQLVVFVNTERCCAKEMVLFPGQTCPEHIHIPVPELNYPGKEETFRCRAGEVYLYVEGEPTENIQGKVPEGYEGTYTVFHEVVLRPGEQYTLNPNTKHWFQAGKDGAIVSEFSTMSLDEYDIFTDKNIKRIPTIE